MQIDVTDYAHAIATQTENVAALRARAKQAAADEVRYRGLVSTGAIAASTYDQVKATADAHRHNLPPQRRKKKLREIRETTLSFLPTPTAPCADTG